MRIVRGHQILNEDFLDSLTADDKTRQSKEIVDNTDAPSKRPDDPNNGYTRLFKIRYDKDNFPNPLFRMSYFLNTVRKLHELDPLADKTVKAVKHLENITKTIETVLENTRFVEDYSDVIFYCEGFNDTLRNALPQIEQVPQKISIAEDDPDSIYILFAINGEPKTVREICAMLTKLYYALQGKITLLTTGKLELQILRNQLSVRWQQRDNTNTFVIDSGFCHFVKSRGEVLIQPFGEYYATVYRLMMMFFGDTDDASDKQDAYENMQTFLSNYNLTETMILASAQLTFQPSVTPKYQEYHIGPRGLDLKPLIDYANDDTRTDGQDDNVRCLIFPTPDRSIDSNRYVPAYSRMFSLSKNAARQPAPALAKYKDDIIRYLSTEKVYPQRIIFRRGSGANSQQTIYQLLLVIPSVMAGPDNDFIDIAIAVETDIYKRIENMPPETDKMKIWKQYFLELIRDKVFGGELPAGLNPADKRFF